MPLVKNIEKRIFEVEGFQVTVRRDGKDVRGDSSLPTQFNGMRMTKKTHHLLVILRKNSNVNMLVIVLMY